ncbi:MAG: sugar dehydrogenase complex small subunit [Roseitalea porphyridii]|uniref:sugar dehydrogenase complex small subunit n=1 Tax=Roseitalea porphyridii TaxID=1852022 RepID=UPI0032D8CA7C
MSTIAPLTRRRFALLTTAAMLAPTAAARAQPFAEFERFAARLRELSGFDPLPRPLVAALADRMSELEKRAIIGRDALPDELRKRVLTALYTGVYTPRGEDQGERIAYPDALMYATVEDTINVPSYCGGLPGFWAQKPETA